MMRQIRPSRFKQYNEGNGALIRHRIWVRGRKAYRSMFQVQNDQIGYVRQEIGFLMRQQRATGGQVMQLMQLVANLSAILPGAGKGKKEPQKPALKAVDKTPPPDGKPH